MNEPTLRLKVKGRPAEMTLSEAREMFEQLKAVFGEAVQVPVVIHEPVIFKEQKVTRTPLPWEPTVWCGPTAYDVFPNHCDYDTLVHN